MAALHALVAAELAESVDPRVAAMGATIAARHPGAARAVLFYGACLRESSFFGRMLDFYLIVSDYRAAYDGLWLTFANALLPPNVFPIEQDGLAAKYAVLSEADFHRLNGPEAGDVSVWARFAQPSRLVWSADAAASAAVAQAVARAAPTLFQRTLPTMPSGRDHGLVDVWRAGFALTYGAELRAERDNRGGAVVDADPGRYARFGAAALASLPEVAAPGAMDSWWRRARRRGKILSLLRLAKATTTYAGGVDYLVWKINRHAGTAIAVRPWQRRWPILAALILLPRLLRRGAVR